MNERLAVACAWLASILRRPAEPVDTAGYTPKDEAGFERARLRAAEEAFCGRDTVTGTIDSDGNFHIDEERRDERL